MRLVPIVPAVPALIGALVLLTATSGAAQDLERPRRVQAGPLVLEVRVSRSAQIFHVVDQLSNWHPSCHGQYREHMDLDQLDEEMLELHRSLRLKRPFGTGLERSLYSSLTIEDALDTAVETGDLTAAEAALERLVLDHFAERVDLLIAARADVMQDVFERVDTEALGAFAQRMAQFTGLMSIKVPTYLIASPTPGKGAMEGGILRLEIATRHFQARTLYHEVAYAFFLERAEQLQQWSAPEIGLTVPVLAEGLAFAVAPGLYDDGPGDPLGLLVLRDKEAGTAWHDSAGFGRRRLFGLALRPLLADSFDKKTLTQFGPRANDVWRALREVEEARPGPALLTAGPGYERVWERMIDSRFQASISSFKHTEEHYRHYLASARSGDTFLMLVALDQEDRAVPDEFRTLCPIPPRELRKRLEAGEKLEETGAARGLNVVLLAAPTLAELEELIDSSDALDS